MVVPGQPLCCGRPLYDYGMMGLARRKLRQTLKALAPYIREGAPVVGLKTSCVAVFRDRAAEFLSPQPGRQKLAAPKAFCWVSLAQKNYQPPPLRRKAILHGHCHQKAIAGMESDAAILRKMEMDFDLLDSGCCAWPADSATRKVIMKSR